MTDIFFQLPFMLHVIPSNNLCLHIIYVEILSPQLYSPVTGMRPLLETSYRNYFLSFMDQLGLVDVYRVLRPKKGIYVIYKHERQYFIKISKQRSAAGVFLTIYEVLTPVIQTSFTICFNLIVQTQVKFRIDFFSH